MACGLEEAQLRVNMESPKSVGRITGILLLVHLAGGLMLPYILMLPVTASPDFLKTAAVNAGRMRAAVLLLFVSGAITGAVALTALPVFRRHGDRMAVLLVVLSAVNLALHAVENGTLLSMLSLSQAYAERSGADAALFHGLGTVVGTARRWAHFTHLLVVGSWIFTLFAVMWRSRLVPRLLAGLGMLTAALQVTGVPLRAVLGLEVVTPMAMPLAPVYLALAGWLMFKGFEERQRPVIGDTTQQGTAR